MPVDQRQALSNDRPARGGPQDLFYSARNTLDLPLMARGEGIYFWDDAGARYIDVSSGAICNNLGQGNERVLRAMYEQGRTLTFTYVRVTRHKPNAVLSDKVAALAGPGFERCHFVSGGSEANEMAIKFLRQYAVATGQASRHKIIACLPSYHGGTLATMGITGDLDYEATYGPMAVFSPKVPSPLVYRRPDGTTPEEAARQAAAALEAEIVRQDPETVLAFIFEPVGGLATGANVPPDPYFGEVRRICDRHGVFLVYDEVMSACRTGSFLAAHHWPDGKPDIVVLAKGLGAGYVPLGAMLAPAAMVDELAELTGFNLAHTYNANPIVSAGAAAVVDEVVERDLIPGAARLGAHLTRRLEAIKAASPIVGDVRGKGLLQAVEIVADKDTKAMIPAEFMAADRIRRLGLENGLLIYMRRTNGGRFGEWFMVSPPLTITEAQVDDMADRLARTLAAYVDGLTRAGALK